MQDEFGVDQDEVLIPRGDVTEVRSTKSGSTITFEGFKSELSKSASIRVGSGSHLLLTQFDSVLRLIYINSQTTIIEQLKYMHYNISPPCTKQSDQQLA